MKSNLFRVINQYLTGQSKRFLIASGFVFLLFVGVGDYITGIELDISIFYLLPIFLLTWFVNMRTGVFLSIVSAAIGLAADLISGHIYLHPVIIYWNRAVHLGFFLIIVFIAGTLRRWPDELKRRVEERTVEFQAANERLEQKMEEHRQAVEALRESEKQLRYLSSQLLTAQETERTRISRELHDELGQVLITLKLHLASVQRRLRKDQKPLYDEHEHAQKDIEEIIENVRRLSRNLSPHVLENLGLSAALRWIVDDYAKNQKITASIDITDINNFFSEKSRIIIYRIFQEVLTNIQKHASATHISAIITRNNDTISFLIEDNGKGFDVKRVMIKNPTEKGLGLATMEERIRMLGGALDIRSHVGGGTRISFAIPISKEGI
jgi:signal transduction histidine kinase